MIGLPSSISTDPGIPAENVLARSTPEEREKWLNKRNYRKSLLLRYSELVWRIASDARTEFNTCEVPTIEYFEEPDLPTMVRSGLQRIAEAPYREEYADSIDFDEAEFYESKPGEVEITVADDVLHALWSTIPRVCFSSNTVTKDTPNTVSNRTPEEREQIEREFREEAAGDPTYLDTGSNIKYSRIQVERPSKYLCGRETVPVLPRTETAALSSSQEELQASLEAAKAPFKARYVDDAGRVRLLTHRRDPLDYCIQILQSREFNRRMYARMQEPMDEVKEEEMPRRPYSI